MSSEQKTLAIVGLGLIGASIAEATRKRYPDWRIIGVSSPKTIQEALELKIIDEGFEYGKVREALGQCDIGFLCTPIDNILKLLQEFIENPIQLKPGAIISDVGSTKEKICELGRKAFLPGCGGIFIGSHPMAGSEKTGIKARDMHLFENAAWITCPDEETFENKKTEWKSLTLFVERLGARTLVLWPRNHDAIVALASHIPQLISTSLAEFVLENETVTDALNVAGGGFRDMMRLAASSFTVWEPILRTNEKMIHNLLSRYQEKLRDLDESLAFDRGKHYFVEANKLRGRFNVSRKGFSSPTTEILIDLEDKPGALLAAITPLSKAGVNILDLEILKVREGEEGTLMMGFRKPGEAQTALDLLAKSGHKARLR